MADGERDVRVILGRHDRRTDRRGLVVQTHFDADFVQEIKRGVPSDDRAWWPEARQWWVHEDHEAAIIALVVFHYGETIIVAEDGSETYLNADGTEAARQERLF